MWLINNKIVTSISAMHNQSSSKSKNAWRNLTRLHVTELPLSFALCAFCILPQAVCFQVLNFKKLKSIDMATLSINYSKCSSETLSTECETQKFRQVAGATPTAHISENFIFLCFVINSRFGAVSMICTYQHNVARAFSDPLTNLGPAN